MCRQIQAILQFLDLILRLDPFIRNCSIRNFFNTEVGNVIIFIYITNQVVSSVSNYNLIRINYLF